MLSAEDLRDIAARATTLWERLESSLSVDDTSADLVERRLQRWREIVADGDEALFSRYLEMEGLDAARARWALGAVRLDAESALPAWTKTLQEVLGDMDAASDERSRALLDPDNPYPFEEIYLPFVAIARRRLHEAAGRACQLLPEASQLQLERELLRRLVFPMAPVLQLDFSIYRTSRQSSLGRLLQTPTDTLSTELYRAYIQHLCSGGLRDVFLLYPALARLAATFVELWVAATAEFLLRLQADLPGLRSTFQGDTELGRVTALRPAYSDPHNGGRRVIAMVFDSGLEVVYKPRDQGLEAAYFGLLDWLNARGAPLSFRTLEVLPREGYGWVEFAAQHPCANRAEAERYYRRCGALLCLTHLLQGADFHRENLIACGEHPVLVDLETLVHPRPRDVRTPGGGAVDLARRRLDGSVLRTGLLPSWHSAQALDLSGLGGIDDQPSISTRPTWSHINSDQMVLTYEPGTVGLQPNVPRLEGRSLAPEEFVDDILAGYRAMYAWILTRREALLEPAGPLHGIARQRGRVVLRATSYYLTLLRQSLLPRHLHDGAERSLQLETLAGDLPPDHERRLRPLLAAERQALEEGDVPYFAAHLDSRDLPLPTGVIVHGGLAQSGWEQLSNSLRQMGPVHLQEQEALIQASLALHLVAGPSRPSAVAAMPPMESPAPGLDDAALLDAAHQIALRLSSTAIRADDGSVTWIAPTYLPGAGRFRLHHVDDSLYDGAGGIALFLAALSHIEEEPRWRDLALAALAPLRGQLRHASTRRQLARGVGMGGGTGLGSFVYVLACVGRLLGEEALVRDAGEVARMVTPKRLADEPLHDVLTGTAGAALALLALRDSAWEPDALERAALLGRHVVEKRTANESGLRTWAGSDGKMLTGFSHGAAGIAYALLRLHEACGDAQLRDAAAEAIAYEASLFCAQESNWPDLRQDGGPRVYQTAWCHGATGIGLARLGGLGTLDNAALRADIEASVDASRAYGAHGPDHLCCGNLGRMELLLVAADRLRRPALWEEARCLAARVLARRADRGNYTLALDLPRGIDLPGLFLGMAGVGYQLLRLACPGRLPSVCLWEPPLLRYAASP